MTKENVALEKMTTTLSREITAEDITKYLCPKATEKEVYMALGIINSLKLNPFTREVHLVKYDANSPISIIVGYEVYIKRADRTGKLDGWEADISEDGQTAYVIINRKDWKQPFKWKVKLSEFSKKQATWNQIPTFMAKKVAIAQGFRLAFPDELGGMPYTQEEADVYDVTTGEQVPVGKPATQRPKEKVVDVKEEIKEEKIESQVEPESVKEESTPIEPPKDSIRIKALAKASCRICKNAIEMGHDIYYHTKSKQSCHVNCYENSLPLD